MFRGWMAGEAPVEQAVADGRRTAAASSDLAGICLDSSVRSPNETRIGSIGS
jgi:hypothetical protein